MASRSEVLQIIIDTLDVVLTQLQDDATPSRRAENFSKEEFWTCLSETGKMVSQECTKLCVAFSQPPLPSVPETQSLVNSLESSCIALLSAFHALPKSQGLTLHKDLRLCVLNILKAVQDLCVEAKNESGHQLQSVGNVWEKCNNLQSAPKDNKTSVLTVFKDQVTMVQDALDEFQESMEQEDSLYPDLAHIPIRNGFQIPDQTGWSEEDLQLLPTFLGLLKASKACIKKTKSIIATQGQCDREQDNNQLDSLASIVQTLSSHVDDFVLSTYPPVIHNNVRQQATILAEGLKELINTANSSHLCEGDHSWTEFLLGAINHNYQKVIELL
ncbi:cyclin-D1-binding protein 1 homolog isoform X1 [Tachypleus tridentatus]|uniref:cyclin-D1-binding protein 1 homolog isoform X1 n=2 Tax=Tachypleus tridentatus TaxID=6853 RepID=UPI003FD2D1A6